jgi:sugar-specific transcriptional regulator TrmB
MANTAIDRVLQKIGLSQKEATVYLTTLRLGSQTAMNIAKYSGLNRTTVYDIFDGLIKKGLATKIDKGAAIYFQVTDPKNLIQYLEREKNDFIRQIEKEKEEVSEILPAIQSIERVATSKPKVQFFEGEKGLREAYEDTLTSTEPIRAYANAEEMHKGLPNFFPEYYKRRKDSDISIRAICPDNDLSKERHAHDAEELRQIKFIAHQQYSFSPELNIYNNKILIASWREKMAVIIESNEIADLHKKMYDLLWSKL